MENKWKIKLVKNLNCLFNFFKIKESYLTIFNFIILYIIKTFKNITIFATTHIPFPFLIFFYSERENTLEEQQQDRAAQVPEIWISFESRYLPNSDETMRCKY